MKRVLFVSVVLLAGSMQSAWGEQKHVDYTEGMVPAVEFSGSEEFSKEELSEEDGITTRAIYGLLIVQNRVGKPLFISRGRYGKNLLGIVPPFVTLPLHVGDYTGDTKLWASTAYKKGKPAGQTWRRTVKGKHITYKWNLP